MPAFDLHITSVESYPESATDTTPILIKWLLNGQIEGRGIGLAGESEIDPRDVWQPRDEVDDATLLQWVTDDIGDEAMEFFKNKINSTLEKSKNVTPT